MTSCGLAGGVLAPAEQQLMLFERPTAARGEVALTEDVSRLLAANCVVAVGVSGGKVAAAARQAAEQRIPEHLLYSKGWPTCMPTREEAELLAGVRRDVAAAIGIAVQCTSVDGVLERYSDLLEQKRAKNTLWRAA